MMGAFLSAAWLDAPVDPLVEAFAATGGTGTVARIVTGAPDGEARYAAVVADGTVRYELDRTAEADVSLTDTYANAVAMVRGDLDPNAAFMRGQTKVTGPTSLLLALFAAAADPAYDQARIRALASLEG